MRKLSEFNMSKLAWVSVLNAVFWGVLMGAASSLLNVGYTGFFGTVSAVAAVFTSCVCFRLLNIWLVK